jgi:hypothetical protein
LLSLVNLTIWLGKRLRKINEKPNPPAPSLQGYPWPGSILLQKLTQKLNSWANYQKVVTVAQWSP